MAQPLKAEIGADPLPEVGYAQDDGASPLGIGEAGHLLGELGGSHLVLAVPRLDGPTRAASSRLLLDVHEALLHVARNFAGG